MPRPDDKLWIVTDGATHNHGIGATLYVTRPSGLHLAGFFSAKLRARQNSWLPCEMEALTIASSVKHYAPFIIQSKHRTCILTDSKPCVQAFEKLCRGEFSASPRVSTYLSSVSRFQASVQHVAGLAILPSDHASRNAPDCNDPMCQVCKFVNTLADCVVRATSTKDILDGNAKLPFTSRSAWLAIQSECADLRRTHAHLSQGTRPSKKTTGVRDVKRYLKYTTIGRDGLVLDGVLTALHIQLDHPTCHQMKMVIHRFLFALDMDKCIEHISSTCHQCAALLKTPNTVIE